MSITIKHKMKNLKGIKTMLKGNKQIVAFEEARKIEKQAIKKGFEDSCRTGKALVEVEKFISSKAFKNSLSKLEAKMSKKEFVKEVLGMSHGGYIEYLKIGRATKPQRDNFLKGCDKLEANGKSVSRSIKNFVKFLNEVKKANSGDDQADGGDVDVQSKETSKGMFQLKLTVDNVVHDVRVDLTSNGSIKTKNEAQAIIKAIDIFKAQVLQGLQSASDKAPKKVAVK